jgi:hypothetical protein
MEKHLEYLNSFQFGRVAMTQDESVSAETEGLQKKRLARDFLSFACPVKNFYVASESENGNELQRNIKIAAGKS